MYLSKNTLLLAVTAFACFSFTGCSKAFDYANHHKGDDIKQLCLVEKLFYGPYGYLDSVTVEVNVAYNSAGNPTSMRVTKSDGQLHMDHYFRYDKQNRLTDYMLAGSGSWQVFIWQRYSYTGKNTIVDSTFNYVGSVMDAEPPHTSFDYRVDIYTLDADGRIAKITSVPQQAGENPVSFNIIYDVYGNRVLPDVTYDTRVSIYRTNKVWMFAFNNYSVNNALQSPLEITGYNQYGLPLRYKNNYTNPSLSQFLRPFGYYYPYTRVEYACDIKGPGGAY